MFIVIIFVLPIVIAITIRRQKKAMAALNKKLRFGLVTSSVISCIPFWLLFYLFYNIDNISKLLKLEIKVVGFFIVVLSLVIIPTIIFRRLYKPISDKQHQKELVYRKRNNRGWKHYILKYPAKSLECMLRLPPVNKYGKPSPEAYRKYHRDSLDVAPSYIQYLLIIITFGITSIGFAISDYLIGYKALIYINLYIIPFLLLITFVGSIILRFIRLTETLLKVSINDVVKYIIFNILFVLSIDVLWLLVK